MLILEEYHGEASPRLLKRFGYSILTESMACSVNKTMLLLLLEMLRISFLFHFSLGHLCFEQSHCEVLILFGRDFDGLINAQHFFCFLV